MTKFQQITDQVIRSLKNHPNGRTVNEIAFDAGMTVFIDYDNEKSSFRELKRTISLILFSGEEKEMFKSFTDRTYKTLTGKSGAKKYLLSKKQFTLSEAKQIIADVKGMNTLNIEII